MTVSAPAAAHARRSPPGEPSRRAVSAETMKMPEPIIEPTTIAVASRRVIRRCRGSGSDRSLNVCRPRDRALRQPVPQQAHPDHVDRPALAVDLLAQESLALEAEPL